MGAGYEPRQLRESSLKVLPERALSQGAERFESRNNQRCPGSCFFFDGSQPQVPGSSSARARLPLPWFPNRLDHKQAIVSKCIVLHLGSSCEHWAGLYIFAKLAIGVAVHVTFTDTEFYIAATKPA